MAQSRSIPVLFPLRGLAALAVCAFHFTNANQRFLPDGDALKSLGAFGWLGVEAFFVISGFVIPYSMHLRGYQLRDAGAFLVRRLKRLEPPYLAALLTVIALHVLASRMPGFQGTPIDLSGPRVLAHIGYLNAILDYGWYNPVFWTLAIEFQYYLFVAAVFPLLAHRVPWVRFAAVLAVAALGLAGAGRISLLPHWLPLFALGMATFQYLAGFSSAATYAITLLLTSLLCWTIVGQLHTAVGMTTTLAIGLIAGRELPRALAPLAFAGTISYSLYLLHVPIGVRFINLADRGPDSVLFRYVAIVVALTLSVAASSVFWRAIEKPSLRWSKS